MKITLATTIIASSLAFISGHEHGRSHHIDERHRLAKGDKPEMSMRKGSKGRKLHLTDEHHRLAKGDKPEMSMRKGSKGRKLDVGEEDYDPYLGLDDDDQPRSLSEV